MSTERNIKIWYGKVHDAEPYPDVSYWQNQPDRVKFDVAWQMVIEAHAMKGEDISESRLQRSVAGIKPARVRRMQDLADAEKLRATGID